MPSVAGFIPYGHGHRKLEGESIFLLYEEYESFKLLDYEKHTQEEAAAVMGVSRPTLTRIYMSAREKIATAFVEGRRVAVEGGKVELDGHWYECRHCGAVFSAPASVGDGELPHAWALCGSPDSARYTIGTDE